MTSRNAVAEAETRNARRSTSRPLWLHPPTRDANTMQANPTMLTYCFAASANEDETINAGASHIGHAASPRIGSCRRLNCILSIPVSYTHLRAHETRHDLVCRLLLEKKKKK